MENIWGRNLKGQKVSPAYPDHSYGAGVLPVIDPFGRAYHHMPLNFSSESKNDVRTLGWEAKCDQHIASILVLEAPSTIKHNEFQWLIIMFYDLPEASNRDAFDAR